MLDLNFEQAEKVYKYEQIKDTYSDKHYFSVWEEWDYELTTFKEILDPDQLNKYEQFLNENTKRYIQHLMEDDTNVTNQILYHQELLSFYEDQFLPDFFRSPVILFGLLLKVKSKKEYLKAEYKRFLNENRTEIITHHFRHYRTYMPNTLKLSLLRHKLSCVLPDYRSFQHHMDEPTRAVADYLISRFQHLPEETEQLHLKKYVELKAFSDNNFKKYFGEMNDGWHVGIGQLSDQEEKVQRVMTLLLLDHDKYGF